MSTGECGHIERARNDGAEVGGIVGESPAMLLCLKRLHKIALTDATALIEGETGTGKELAARGIHYASRRRNQPFICVNCGALPDTLVENELFGHVRGSYTDASRSSEGLIADAQGGTLFLDEIEAISPRAQITLLRFLQDGSYRPIGSRSALQSNVRVIAASNASLIVLAREGRFREDLLYRLRLMVLEMPPLRERKGDLPLLTQYFISRLASRYSTSPKSLSPSLVAMMNEYSWPGNVRELESFLHRSFVFCESNEIGVEDAEFPVAVWCANSSMPPAEGAVLSFNVAKARAIADFERDFVRRALESADGNISAAARQVGKERRAFGKLMKKHGIRRDVDLASAPRT